MVKEYDIKEILGQESTIEERVKMLIQMAMIMEVMIILLLFD